MTPVPHPDRQQQASHYATAPVRPWQLLLRVVLVVIAILVTAAAIVGSLARTDGENDAPEDRSAAALVSTHPVSTPSVTDDSSASASASGGADSRTDRRGTRSKAVLPPAVPEEGPGVFKVVDAPGRVVPHGAVTYSVEVEKGLVFPPGGIAGLVDATLTDPRGWRSKNRRLVRVDGGAAIRVRLATPATADTLCAPLQTRGRLSCRNGVDVVLNAWRWANGSKGYRSLREYRQYVINHEVGHALGFSHVGCPAHGGLAPVMMQQTLGLKGCRPNPWPAPFAAPAAEW